MADKKQTMLYGLLTSIASKITYDNTESGLTADNVQDAIDEIAMPIYSTTKRQIGVCDGKKVYRKRCIATGLSSSTTKDGDRYYMDAYLGLGDVSGIINFQGTITYYNSPEWPSVNRTVGQISIDATKSNVCEMSTIYSYSAAAHDVYIRFQSYDSIKRLLGYDVFIDYVSTEDI